MKWIIVIISVSVAVSIIYFIFKAKVEDKHTPFKGSFVLQALILLHFFSRFEVYKCEILGNNIYKVVFCLLSYY